MNSLAAAPPTLGDPAQTRSAHDQPARVATKADAGRFDFDVYCERAQVETGDVDDQTQAGGPRPRPALTGAMPRLALASPDHNIMILC